MLLVRLKQHLEIKRLVSMFDMKTRFNLDPEILRNMLQHWIAKGKVRQRNKTEFCGGKCIKCDPLIVELYEWVV